MFLDTHGIFGIPTSLTVTFLVDQIELKDRQIAELEAKLAVLVELHDNELIEIKAPANDEVDQTKISPPTKSFKAQESEATNANVGPTNEAG